MNTKIKEVPSWEVPEFATGGPAADIGADFEENFPADGLSDAGTQSAFSRIEAALHDVAYQLGESEHAAEHYSEQPIIPSHRSTSATNEFANRSDEAEPATAVPKYPVRTRAPEVNAATREYARSLHELAHRIDNLEKFADTESLRDEVRGLRQRFIEDSDQFDSTLNESAGKISALSGAVENLAGNLAVMQDRSKQLGATLEQSLNKLSHSLKHSETQLSNTEKRISEDVENRLSFTDHDIEKVSQRLERTEIGREEKDRAIKQALTALLEKLSAEKERNKEALEDVHTSLASSLMEMKQGLSISETRLWEIVEGRIAAGERGIEEFKQRLSQTDRARSERDLALTDALEKLRNQITAEKTRSDAALTEVRSTLTSSLVSCLAEMKQGLDASEKRIQERLESRTVTNEGNAEAVGNMDDTSLNQNVASMLDQLSADRKKSVAALAEVHASLASSVSKMKQGLDESEKRVEKRLESRFSSIDAKFEKISQRLEKTEKSRNGNEGSFSEIIESMSHRLEQIERERSTGEHPLNEAVGNIARRLDRVEQDQSPSDQPLNEAVGNIVQRLEHIEQHSARNDASVDEAIAELKSELKSEKDHKENVLSEIRSSLAEAKKELADPAQPKSKSSYSNLGFESVSHINVEKERSVTEIIEELTVLQNGEEATIDAQLSDGNPPEFEDVNEVLSVAPASFDRPPMEEGDSVSPEVEGSFSDNPESDEPVADEQEPDGQENFVTPGDYLSGARRAAQAAAEAASMRKPKQSSLQSLTTRVMSRDVKSGFFQRNRLAAIGAAVLLIGGASAFLLSRGSAPSTNSTPVSIVAVTPTEQIDVTVPATPSDFGEAATNIAALPAPEAGSEESNAPGTETEDALSNLANEVDGQVINELAIDGPSVDGPQIEAAAEATTLEQLISEARAGSSPAALILGINYLNGDGVAESESEAFRWFRLAAEQGEPVAQSRLGSMFERGQGVAADSREAAFWHEQAARSGNVRAMHNLAIAHADGAGVEENLGEAARLFRNAADLGLADSQFNLAVLYSGGMGVPVSLSEAYKWYLIAAAQGDSEAEMRAEALAAELPQNERDAAQAAAAAFTPLTPNEAANTPPTLAQIQ